MARSVATLLMFDGSSAEEAMNFYVSLFGNSEVKSVERFGSEEVGTEGTIKKAVFSLRGHEFVCFDSPIKHEFTFTPAISVAVECESETELDEAYKQLSAGGEVLMPLDNYGFSRKFGWVTDRFGVSWHLNLQ